MHPAIIVAGYNRPKCLERILKSINKAYYPTQDITLVVSLDYSDCQSELIELIKRIGWNHGELKIRAFNERQGLKRHILSCGDLTEQYGAVIVLEDDLYVSPNYYDYVIQMVEKYSNEERLCGFSLYCHSWNGYGDYQFLPQRNEFDVFWGQIGVSWGQCWTRRQWHEFKEWYEDKKDVDYFTNNIPSSINYWGDQSWAKYFNNYMVEKDKYYIMPYTSLSTNFSDMGEHNKNTKTVNTYQVMMLDANYKEYNLPDYDEAIKYDMFFERQLDASYMIEGIKAGEICFNLYGYREDVYGKKYILTCNQYEGVKAIKTYGLRLRPIEQNVLCDIEGNEIFLYKVSDIKESITTYRKTSFARIDYELYGNPKRRLEVFCEEIDRQNRG